MSSFTSTTTRKSSVDRASIDETYEDSPDSVPLESTPLPLLHKQFVTRINQGDHQGIVNMLAHNVRIQDSLRASVGMQGVEKVAAKLSDVCSKMKSAVQNCEEEGVEMRDTVTTRTVVRLKKGMVKVQVGCSITWRGGMVSLLTLQKSCPQSFLTDDTSPPSSNPSTSPQNSPSSTLSPPYIIPRPP
eukprot:CAMPEP_0118644924 /NCGR_PEP_ID=MMETSP0785-20121206/7216_1 /TAXON_ID=91992 /ORGANISM="Bolidomonas pacifica, Strain CCMP 1866" /LENGTH=186 /DNA_ID=CAMNT_0006536751 /DNA_START=42 /DNA_END=598 /DNA_ORIENTATION=-